MPIVSKRLDYARQQRNGMFNVRERHTDSKGKHHHFVYNIETEAAAVVKMNARELTKELKRDEANDFQNHLEVGGLLSEFTFVDLTRANAKTIVRKFFSDERDGLIARKAQLDAIITEIA